MGTLTPEGKVKRKISALLKETPGVYYFMPVPGGFGESTLDYVGCLRGRFFAIEAKRPGGKPTPRQETMLGMVRDAGGMVFVINGDLGELQAWLLKG